MKKAKAAAVLLSAGIMMLLLCSGCSLTGGKADTDTSLESTAVSSQEEVRHVDATEVLEVQINGQKNDEVFWLQYTWYGEEYSSVDSFHKIMMTNYSPKGNSAPGASESDKVSFIFNKQEEAPDVIKLTQYANTVRADSGLPYDVLELKLTNDGHNVYSFHIQYRDYKMYYYLLECEWTNGNKLQCAFALEKLTAD